MAVTRRGTFGAENHSVTNLDLFAGGTNPPVLADIAKTGAHAYRHTGSAFGRSFTATAVRSVCALRHGGMKTAGRLPIVTVAVNYTPLCVMWEPGKGELQLMAGFEEGSASYRYPISAAAHDLFATNPTAWKIVGIAAKIAETDGYVSFYLDGQRLLNWTGDTRIFALDGYDLCDTITGVYWYGDEYNVTFSDDYWPVGEWGDNSLCDDLTIDSLTDADAVDAEPRYRALLWTTAATNGSVNQWAPVGAVLNADAVKDNPPDDAASYVTTAAPDQTDEFVPAQISLAGYLPEVVTVVVRGKRASTGEGANVGIFTKIEDEQETAPAQALRTDWSEIEATFWTKPNSVMPWDATGIGEMKIGIVSSE